MTGSIGLVEEVARRKLEDMAKGAGAQARKRLVEKLEGLAGKRGPTGMDRPRTAWVDDRARISRSLPPQPPAA
ncbi:MAG: hypothetical protein IH627_02005 [Rubrivivax sp.]|nr:hypothetical protein [Rubrivivax sp.]